MWIADKYIDHVKEKTAAHPGESWEQMLLGFKLNKLRTKVLPKIGYRKEGRWRYVCNGNRQRIHVDQCGHYGSG